MQFSMLEGFRRLSEAHERKIVEIHCFLIESLLRDLQAVTSPSSDGLAVVQVGTPVITTGWTDRDHQEARRPDGWVKTEDV